MDIVSKKNKPITSIKFSKYNYNIVIFILFLIIISFIINLLEVAYNANEIEENITRFLGIITILFFIILFLCFKFEFEIYNKYFAVCFSLIFLPFKIIIVKLLFDNIDWIDCRQYISGKRGDITYQIRIYLKNDKRSFYWFFGKRDELYNIANNWKKIAKYERNIEDDS